MADCELSEARFERLEFLNQGTYGQVYKAFDRETGQTVVIKALPVHRDMDLTSISTEIEILHGVNHPNVVRCHGYFLDSNKSAFHLVLDYASKGDMTSIIAKCKSRNRPLSEDRVWKYLIQIAQGLEHLHSLRILHRDIKPHNILISANDDILIGDLGLGRILGDASMHACSRVGTPLYMSPELCMDRDYDHKSDVWAFGCLLYELMAFRTPFLASNAVALSRKIISDRPTPLPKTYSMPLRQLVASLLNKNDAKRPSLSQVLNSPQVKAWQEQQVCPKTPSGKSKPVPEAKKPITASAMDTEKDIRIAELEKEVRFWKQKYEAVANENTRWQPPSVDKYKTPVKAKPRRSTSAFLSPGLKSPNFGRARRIPTKLGD